ncbi:hypothetical protein [Streptomyces sp. NPDC102264]|uniref:hypothetical protein n=1 Tax=Streptomyces sp. NPDC102264 TaxID=3366149 RepID=UPI0038120224
MFFSVSTSLDGFIAPESSEDLMGRQWMELRQWIFPQRFFRENLKLGEGGEEGRDNDIVREMFERTGASVMGKRMFDAGDRGVRIAGGGATILEYVNAGLIDEFSIALSAKVRSVQDGGGDLGGGPQPARGSAHSRTAGRSGRRDHRPGLAGRRTRTRPGPQPLSRWRLPGSSNGSLAALDAAPTEGRPGGPLRRGGVLHVRRAGVRAG